MKPVTVEDIVFKQGVGVNATLVSLAFVLQDGLVAWGDCVDTTSASYETLHKTINDVVVPFLKGRTLARFRDISAEIDTLEETVHIVKTTQPPAPEGVSRRNLFRADFDEKLPPAIVEEWDEIRPIPASIRYGISQALLHAFALVNSCRPVDVICDAYSLRTPDQPVPIHVSLKPQQLKAAQRIFQYKVGTLAVAFTGVNPLNELGKKGEFAQRAARQMREAALAVEPPNRYEPVLYLDLAGGYRPFFEQGIGKVLGNLSGLESAAKPYPVWVEDALLMDDFEATVEANQRLMEFLRLRESMKVRIVLRRPIESLGRVKTVLEAKVAHYLVLDPIVLGGFHTVVEAFFLCKAAGVGVILGGNAAETMNSAELSAQVALAIQPARVLAKPASQVGIATMANAMRRTLEELHLAKR